MTRHALALALVALLALGCSASPPAGDTTPKTPAAEPDAPVPASTADAEPAASVAPSPEPGPELREPEAAAPPTVQEEPKAREVTQEPINILLGRETAFILDYANSGASELAKKGCSGDDAEKTAECLAKARGAFEADVLRFRRDSGNSATLIIYRRKGEALVEVFIGQVKLTEKSPTSVEVDIRTNTNGKRPIFRSGSRFTLAVPTSYTLEIDDPTYGRLPYDAKIGMVKN